MARVNVLVTVRDATRAGLRQVRNSINSLNRGILRSLSDVFQDGIGQALARGLNAATSNPYVAAAIVALVGVIVMQIGTALAGALTLAFGGAFIALGVMAVKNSKKVKAAFSKELKGLKKDFKDAAQPLIPVLVHAAKKMGEVGRAFAPMFKQAMKDAAPALTTFIDGLSKGIKEFASRGFKPMMTAFNDLITTIDFEGFFKDLGDAFGNLGRTVSANKEAVSGVLEGLLNLLPMAINLTATLTAAWGKVGPFFKQNWETIKILLTPAVTLLGVAFKVLGDIMAAMAGPMRVANMILRAIMEVGMQLAGFIGRTLGPIWKGLVEGFTEGWVVLEKGLIPVLRDLWGIVKATAGTILEIFLPGITTLDEKAGSAGRTLKEWIIDKMTALSNWLQEHREDIKNWAQKIADGAIVAAKFIRGLIEVLMKAFGWVIRNWDLILTVTGINFIITLIGWAKRAWGWIKRNWKLILKVTGIQSVIDIINWVRKAWGWVNRNWRRVVRFRLTAGGVLRTLKSIWNWVNRNWFRNIRFSVSVGGAVGLAKKLLGFSSGGAVGLGRRIGTAATGGIRNNMTLVGEQGPELVDLPVGSRVRSNPDTRRLMRQGRGGGGSPALIFKSSGRRVDDLLLEILREAIAQRGGDPVKVLGG